MSAESWTKTTESGAFIRTSYRKGKRRKQDTKRFKKNDEKVVLGYIADFEVYVYPYNFPDTVFIGSFPTATSVTLACVGEIMSAYNKATWFLKGEWQNKSNWRKGPNSRRREIVSAYNTGLEHQKKLKNDRISR